MTACGGSTTIRTSAGFYSAETGVRRDRGVRSNALGARGEGG